MKKILSLVLVLCMLVTSCVLFSSCAKVNTKDIEKNPQATLNEAFENMSSDFFTDDADMGKVIKKALESGAVTLSFESEDLMGGMLTKISETVYMNEKDKKIVSDTAVTMGGEELAARIFFDKSGIAINSEAILGSNKTLAIKLATLSEKLENSFLATMMELEAEDMAEVKDTIEQIKIAYESGFEEDKKEAEKFANELYKLLGQTVSTETVELPDGKKVKCAVASYSITNDTLEAFLKKAYEKYAPDDADADEAVGEMLASLDEAIELNVTAKVYINQKTNKVVKMGIGGSVTAKEVDETATLALDLLFTDKEITVSLDVTDIEEPVSIDAKLTKEEADGTVTYKLSVDATSGSVTVNGINASYSYTKKTGDIALNLDIYNDGDERIAIELKGKITVTKDEAKIEFTSLKFADTTVAFKLTVGFKATAEIPEVPTDAKDVMDLTEEDWTEIMTEFQGSKLGSLIFGMAQ